MSELLACSLGLSEGVNDFIFEVKNRLYLILKGLLKDLDFFFVGVGVFELLVDIGGILSQWFDLIPDDLLFVLEGLEFGVGCLLKVKSVGEKSDGAEDED